MKRTALVFLLIPVLCGLMAGMAVAQQAKFGVAIPLSGAYAAMAEEMRKGAVMATDEINAAGGVLGSQAQLIIRDDELKADVALRRYKEMVETENVKVIGGQLSGAISLVANEYACKNGLLFMAFCQTSLSVGKEFCGSGFTSAIIPYQSAAALAPFAVKNLGKKWLALTADYRWGHDNLASWIYNMKELGGEFLGNIYHPIGARDYSAFIPQILAAKPDFLVVTNFGTDQTASIKQFGELGLTKRMKIVISKTHIITIKESGLAFDENVYGAVTYNWKLQDKYPESKKFVKAYWDKFGSAPSADAECAYVGTKAVFEAMKKAGTKDDVPKLIKTLETMAIETPKGKGGFRECDHTRVQSVLILRGKGAKASGWDVADVVQEVPWKDTLQTCENNKKDMPYGQVKLPGK
jgi:branched-chain amino acid transport system substrate-binding protein